MTSSPSPRQHQIHLEVIPSLFQFEQLLPGDTRDFMSKFDGIQRWSGATGVGRVEPLLSISAVSLVC